MSQCQATEKGIALSGPVTFDTVSSLYEESCFILSEHTGGSFTVCFKDVVQVDSAALTLMLSWLRFAASAGVSVRFLAIPQNLYHIAELGGVAELLQLELHHG